MARQIDCIVVGYNDWDFRRFIEALEPSRQYSSAFLNVLKNTVPMQGRRLLYNELLGDAMTKASGRPCRYNTFEVASLGGCYLTSFLRRRGHHTELVNFFTYDQSSFAQMLDERPRVVAITTTFYFMPQPVQEIVSFVRARSPETLIVVGGPYVYNICSGSDVRTQDLALKSLGADLYIFDSQGELTLERVVAAAKAGKTVRGVPNVIIRSDDEFTRTQREVENNDLDQESEDWDGFDPQLVTPVTFVRTARSCAFACAFCSYPDMAGPLALKSVRSVERELRTLKEMGGRFIIFIDDTFNVPLPRFKSLLRMMIDNQFGFRWVSFLRCSNIDEEGLDLMAASGCYGVVLGIESGDQHVLNLMNKSAKIDRYGWGIQELHRRGIATSASFIVGFPGETRATVEHTIEFIERTAPTFYVVEQYFHSNRTPVNDRAADYGLRGGGYTWQHSTMKWSEAADLVGEVYRRVKNSRILPLYGLGMWGLPYLDSKGLDLETVKGFVERAQPMLVASMDDTVVDLSTHESHLVEWLTGRLVGSDRTSAIGVARDGSFIG